MKSKEKILIDVLWDEVGEEYFKVYKCDSSGAGLQEAPNACNEDGVFINDDDLELFLKDNADKVEVVKDWRDLTTEGTQR